MCSAVAALSDAHLADLLDLLGLSAHEAVGLFAESPPDPLIDGVSMKPCRYLANGLDGLPHSAMANSTSST